MRDKVTGKRKWRWSRGEQMNGLNRDMKTMDTDLVLRGERSPVKHIASLATKEKDQVTGMCTTQPI